MLYVEIFQDSKLQIERAGVERSATQRLRA